jgi:hypothetical protein
VSKQAESYKRRCTSHQDFVPIFLKLLVQKLINRILQRWFTLKLEYLKYIPWSKKPSRHQFLMEVRKNPLAANV